jgi:hypothetical protein
MYEINKLNQLILDSLPHWAMLIDVKTRTVLSYNKFAMEGGAQIDCQCWDDFAHRSFISKEHIELIGNDPERIRDNKIKCDFCLADEAMECGKPERKEVNIDGTILDTWWVPVEENIYLHYAIDITEIRKTQKELEDATNEIKTLKGIIPICMHCKGIRDDKGYWNQLEKYITEHSEAQFSHGICETCLEKHYPEDED